MNTRYAEGYAWTTVIAAIVIHVLAIGSLYFFSWEGIIVAFVLFLMTGLGVTIGYHRYLTHAGFETYEWVRRTLAVLGMLSGEGPPVFWVALHRQHHQCSDKDGDPHSPLHGFFHAHVLWTWAYQRSEKWAELFKQYAPDLRRERFMNFLSRTYVWWHGGVLILLVVCGALYGWFAREASWSTAGFYAMSFAGLGFFTRMALVLNVTWCVNSAAHRWGYRTYETADESRNNWLVGLLAFGEGWHNNHHAKPRLACHGHRWWEIDASYYIIKLMERIGLVRNVQDALSKPQKSG